MNCGGRLRTTPWKSLMRRALFYCNFIYQKTNVQRKKVATV